MKQLLLKSEKSILLIFLLVVTSVSRGQSTQSYTTSGTFIAPAGVTTIQVEAYGGGGGGARGGGSNRQGGGGGGGGGYTINNTVSVVPGTSYTITVGTGGNGSNSGNGANGTTTTATFGATTVNATGGAGGTAFSGSTGPGGAGGTGTRAGGAGGTGTTAGSGGGGGAAGTASAGSAGTVTNGGNNGGGGIAGSGGNGTNANNAAGNNGNNYGAGGGGATRTSRGGNGAGGYMRITYTCPTYALTSATTATGPFCGTSSSVVTLSSTSLTSGTYTVNYTLSGATIQAATNTSVTFTAGSPGTGTFTTPTLNVGTTTVTINSITSSYCTSVLSSNNTASVIVNAVPTSNAGTAINTCFNSGAVNITAGASSSNGTSTVWTSSGTGTFVNPNSLVACTYTPSAADILAGSVTLTLTISNVSCGSAISTKTLTIHNNPTANAGTAITTCSSSAAVSITAGSSATNQTLVTWTSSGTGTFTNPNSLTLCTYNPSAADKTAGSVTLTLTASNGGCANATSNKTLTITTAATAVAGTAINTCTTTPVNVTLGSSATNHTSVTWSSSGTGTFTNANSLTLCTYTASAADVTAGSVTLTLTAAGNAPCGTVTSTKILTINSPSTVTGTTPGSRVGTGTVVLGATASAGTLNWFAAATGGVSLGTGTSFTTPSISVTTTFYVEAVNGTCPPSTRTAVVATVLQPEINIIGNALSIVDGDTSPTNTDWTIFTSAIIGNATTRIYTIQNTGTGTLTLGAITFSGANAGDFSVTTAPSASIPAGGSTNFIVRFIPSAVGVRVATISIVTNDTNENPYDYAIQGTGLATPPAPSNDECASAISLTVGSSCTYSTYTNAYATASASIPAPGCASYNGSDVWFSAVVPANGILILDSQTGAMTDSGMALYTGACAGLTLVTCDDDSSMNGAMSYIYRTGLTPGATVYIRFWSYNNSNNGTFGICASTVPALTNDNCSGATTLTVNTSNICTTSTNGTTVAATQSQVGCAGTADDDVWYQFIATTTSHIVTVTPNTLSDAVFQVFSGSCGSLTSLACVDATSGSGIETTTLTGLTIGQPYFVRVHSYGNGSGQGTFSICVTRPTPTVANDDCSGAIDVLVNPTIVCTVNTTGSTFGATQSLAACSGTADDDVWYKFTANDIRHTITVRPASVSGNTLDNAVFQVYSGDCAGGLTNLACVNASSGPSSEAITVNSLTIGNTYYIRIHSNANGSGQGGFTLCITSPCTQGSGNSTKMCETVVAGGLGLSGADPAAINSCTASTCTNLEATFLQLGNTTDYTVQSIPYAPPYQYTCLKNSVSVDIDDVWSQPVSIPFNFCYYGNTYSNFLISSNGAITFDTTSNPPGGYSEWNFSTNVPSATLFLNTIFGVYHDIDPSINGEIGWELVNLSSGCRAMVISWADVPMFSATCNPLTYTGMIVLYENTNIIEVYIKDKVVCSSWNDANAVVGIQNATGTAGVVAPNRNSLDPDWTTSNEAWRFLPSGPSITTVTWYEGSGTSGPVVGTSAVINVCPTATTTYTAKVEYTLCNGSILTLTDPTTVTVSPVNPTILTTTPGSRTGTGTVTLGATTNVGTISWYAASSGGTALGTGTSFTTPSIAITTTYYVESVSGSCTSTRVPVIATIIPGVDTDGDGIYNNVDLDDDNDGISDILEGNGDVDGDGVINSLDLDSDNDGIGDIIEDRFSTFSNGKDTMDLSLWTDANGNGWDDSAETYYGTNATADFDTDSRPNYLDLDSDNDALFDVDEAGLLNGDGDINGDGKGDGSDTDGDGILNAFDSLVTFGNTGKALPTNTLGSGNPDYLKLSSLTLGVFDITTTLYATLDANNDGKIDGSTDVDADGIRDAFDTNTALFGSPRDLDRKLFLDFDGRNDYAEDSAILGGLTNASLMAWIDLNNSYSGIGFVVGQDKFHIRVTGSKILQAVVNGTILSYGTPLNTSQWYHVAATYANGNLTLYLNGESVANVGLSGSIAADASKLALGRNPATGLYYFKGKIDEVRVFDVALTAAQIEKMVYQEIQNTASQVRGTIVPKDISALPFANVLKYYRMDAYKDDIVDNLTTAAIDSGTGMKLYNHKVIAVQQAPMPFTTVRTGTFSDAINDTTKDIRGLDVSDYDYSIVQVKHNITETANTTNLALFIDSGITVNMTNDTKLQNDWYLKLDGKIDLVGKSQLVQTTDSELDVTSAGSLERDQQGQSNKFNYNYWSSPVSSINATTNNHGFTVAGVMKDGTNVSSPQNLQWTSGINGSATAPITLSSYWIFKFQNSTNSYANWASVGQNGALLPGQGFTMKGAGAATADQNYTFVGKPNTGTITSTVGPNNLNLCGNPYPSAIDADQFIDDNAASIVGTLYVWEHYSTNSSHNTIAYQGGYGTYTKTGGTAPVAPAGVSGLGSSSKVAKRFIPVGQGFFVTGSAAGGTITFNNAQRLFIKEDDAVNSYTMFKSNNHTVATETNPAMNNAQDEFVQEDFMKLRLGYNSTDNYHRQTLLGFMNENATAGYDNGYDGLSIETLTNDMYFINGTNKLNINGDGFFNVNNVYPIGVKNATSGNVTFVIDNKENFDDNQEIYIHDNVTNTYNSIKSQSYVVNLPAGTYDTRFSLRFTDGTALGTGDNDQNHGIAVTHSQSNNMINIKNVLQEVTVKSVALFNLLGQKVTQWDIDNQDQANIQLKVTDISTGTYIVKVTTDGGEITKKILVKK